MTQRILVVEDEVKIAQLLKDYLLAAGFEVEMQHEGDKALAHIASWQPDFLILDVMLPGKDGLEICKEVRQVSDIPIMMITARVDEIDRLLGLELGADDYVCKPFSTREVVVRVRNILRRVQSREAVSSPAQSQLRYRDLTIDTERFTCHVQAQAVELTPVEFRMLKAMLAQPGRVFSRDTLMDVAYDDGRVVSHRTIDSHMKNLRKKLSSQGDELLHSIYGVGYKVE